jgi:CBS domain-containing protein
MISLAQVKEVAKEVWGFKQVRDLMTPVEALPVVRPDDDVAGALERMAADSGPLLVMDEGRLLGIVSRRDILNLFKIKSDLGVA